ncbi:hypothetical protein METBISCDRAFT_21168 [Metschnikowia bicuspidata]|uniref:MFS general substrate transporter n=1 Tax=Metschnikowia bicuspidata TaxID=27322 RepID=A0A4P9ZIA6_9ASCO|nr:hypothetical protein METBISCDRAFT_21168 [Metschnikowia bicuspidata]
MTLFPAETSSVEFHDIRPELVSTKSTDSKNGPLEINVDITVNDLALRPLTVKYEVLFQGKKVYVESLDWRNSRLLKAKIFAAWALFILFGLGAYFIIGVGFGCLEAALNGWMGTLVNISPLLGILHGCYGIGCITTPPLVTALITKKNKPWGLFHY